MTFTIEQTLELAIEAHKAGRLADAEKLYRAILQAQPQHPDANHNLGVLAMGEGKRQSALGYLLKALEANPSHGRFWISYIHALLEVGELDNAERALNEGKHCGLAGAAVEQLEARLGELRAKSEAAADAPSSSKSSRKSYKDKEKNKVARAVRARLQGPSPHDISALLTSYRAGDLAAVERAALGLAQRFPNHPFGWKTLGAVYRSSGRLDEALDAMRQAARADSKDADTRYNLGVTLQTLGRLDEAENSYRDALELAPEDAEAHGNLGVLLKELGRLTEAERSYREALRLKPDYADAHGNLGNVLREQGRLEEAEASLREALRLAPENAKTHYNLGLTLQSMDRLAEAEPALRQAIALAPALVEAQSTLGAILMALGRFTEAEISFREAIRLAPAQANLRTLLGDTLKALDRKQEAKACYAEALRIDPESAEAYNSLGLLCVELGRLQEAEASYREAVRINPESAEAFSNLGVVLLYLGRTVEAEASCRQAAELAPASAKAHNNLAIMRQKLQRLSEAEAGYREAIRLAPEYAEAHNNLGSTLKDMGRMEEAEASYRRALELRPEYNDAYNNLFFSLNYSSATSAEAAFAEAKRYGAAVSERTQPKFTEWRRRSGAERLRVGFVSGDLREHPVGFFAEGVLRRLDPNQFELYAFSTTVQVDHLSVRVRPFFQEWVVLEGKSDREAAELIHERGIDVLIDLAGLTARNRLPIFAYRPAPVQALWLGYFATTGLPEMDFFVGCRNMLPAGEEARFTEKLWRLPETWMCFTPPEAETPIGSAPALCNGYVTYGCFGNLSKMDDPVIEIWGEILRQSPQARLLLKSRQLEDSGVVEAVRQRFARLGAPIERLELEGPSTRAEYLEAYNRIDLVLDTFPYPGGTTSTEALWMGVPVLTLQGDRFLSRLGESIVRAAGRPEWVAVDQAEYVRKAVALGADPQSLAEQRASLRSSVLSTPLFDIERFARDFEQALLGMYAAR